MLEIAAENEKTALEDVTEYSATDFGVQIPSPRLNFQEKLFGEYAEGLFGCPVGTFRSTAEFKPNRTGLRDILARLP